MIKLQIDKVLSLHRLLTAQTGGDPAMRDFALLDSALASPFQTFDGQPLYPSVEEKGARLCFSLIANHAFVDGNKRMGMYALLIFLSINGVAFHPTVEDVVRVGFAVAAGEMGYEDLLSWIRAVR